MSFETLIHRFNTDAHFQRSVISAVLTYGGFAIMWYNVGFFAALATFMMILGFFVWNSK